MNCNFMQNIFIYEQIKFELHKSFEIKKFS